MSALLKLAPLWVWAALALAAMFGIQQLRISLKDAQLAKAEAKLATTEAKAASLGATLKIQRELTADRDALDARYTRELSDARQANDRLAADVAAGRTGLRVKANCPVPRDPAPSGVGDGAVELSSDARSAYFAHREEVSRDQAKLAYLQSYVSQLLSKLSEK